MEIIKQINTEGEIQQMNKYQQFKEDYEIGKHTFGFEIDGEGMESLEPSLDEMKFMTKLLMKILDEKIDSNKLEEGDWETMSVLEHFMGYMSCDWGNFTEEMDKYYMAYYNKFGNN